MRKIIEKAVLIIWLPVIVLLISSVITAIYGTYLFEMLLVHR